MIIPSDKEDWYRLIFQMLVYSFSLVVLLCVGLVCCCLRELMTGVGQIAQTLEEEHPTCFNYLVAARERALDVKQARAKLKGTQKVQHLLRAKINLLPEYVLVVRALEELAARKKDNATREFHSTQTREELVEVVAQNVRFLGSQGDLEIEQGRHADMKGSNGGMKKKLVGMGMSILKRKIMPLLEPKPRAGIPRDLLPARIAELLINYAQFLV
jgi:hypothetical protein